MRKIEQIMIDRINKCKIGYIGGNTFIDILPVIGAVGNDPDKYCVSVTLYATEIARLFINKQTGEVYAYEFFHGGYRTNTTKSRLNALAHAFHLEPITQKAFVWYHKGFEF